MHAARHRTPRHSAPPHAHARSGITLVVVLVLMTALLFVGAAFTDAIVQSTRAERLGWRGDRAASEADAALLGAIAGWDSEAAAALRPGETDTVSQSGSSSVRTMVSRVRLDARTFLLEGHAEVQAGALRPAGRRTGRIVQLDWPDLLVSGALAVTGAVELGGSATVLGAEAVPAGWERDCVPEQPPLPWVAISAASASLSGGALASGRGDGVQLLTPAHASALAIAAADLTAAAVARTRTVVTADSVLDLDERSGADGCPRWLGLARRDASAPERCARRWPVVVASHPRTTRLTGVTPAQGLLVVQGDLHLAAGVRFAGLIVVHGRLTADTLATAAMTEVAGSRDGPRSGRARNSPGGADTCAGKPLHRAIRARRPRYAGARDAARLVGPTLIDRSSTVTRRRSERRRRRS